MWSEGAVSVWEETLEGGLVPSEARFLPGLDRVLYGFFASF